MKWAAVALLFVLAACTGETPPPSIALSPPIEPTMTGQAFVAEDGAILPYRSWLPEGKPRAIVLALHGFNDYSKAFKEPGERWARSGIATYAYDQRGFGAAPRRGFWAGTKRLDADLALVARLLRERYPGTALYLLGESMGGAVVATAVTGAAGASRPDSDGIILSAPAVWGRATMNVFERAALWSGNILFPGLTLTGRGLDITPSDNIDMLRELSRDPLVIKETRLDTIHGLVDLMDQAFASAPRIEGPTLILYGQHDEVVPEHPTRQFIANLPRAANVRSRIAWYEHGYHMLLRDLEAKLVLGDIESWIDDHEAALPSGADRHASDGLLARSGSPPPRAAQ